jgi:hypothetical protein
MCSNGHSWPVRRHDLLPLTLILVFLASGNIADGASPNQCRDRISLPTCTCSKAQSRHDCVAGSPKFVVRSFVDGPSAPDVAKHCEAVCSQLRTDVFNLPNDTRWNPKCRVVLHGSRASYQRAVGHGSDQTLGSSNVVFAGRRVTQRRIDLLAVNWKRGLAALPHELVHILFAEVCPTTAPPKWAEEGLALLFDSADKRARHRNDLEAAINSGTTLPLDGVLSGVDYPAASQRAAFYAQSLALADYLTQLDTPREFVRFAKLSTERGPNHAMSVVYGIDSRELDRDWKQYAAKLRLASTVSK